MTSSAKHVKCGAPQGSNIGPFLLCINYLPNSFKMSKSTLIANDTNLACKEQNSSKIEMKLNEELENVHQWLKVNKLNLKRKKSTCLFIMHIV